MRKILLIMLCLSLSLSIPTMVIAQTKVKEKGHYMKIKPKHPKYTKVAAPAQATSYVYVSEDWTWDDGTNEWKWNGNRWVQIPQPGQTWVPGHWTNTSMGWMWTDGYWK